MMASGHAKTGSVSVALKVYLLALFVGLYHFESNKTRQKPSYLFVRDKLPMITALLANQSVLGDKVKHRGKHYLPGRILHTSNGTSSFQIEKHLLICGEVSSNPGPSEKPKSEISMRRMPQERSKQPRRHLVCYMQIMVPRKMSQYVEEYILLLLGSPRH